MPMKMYYAAYAYNISAALTERVKVTLYFACKKKALFSLCKSSSKLNT